MAEDIGIAIEYLFRKHNYHNIKHSFKFFHYAFKMIPKIIHDCSALSGLKKNVEKMIKTLENPEQYVFTMTFNVVFHF